MHELPDDEKWESGFILAYPQDNLDEGICISYEWNTLSLGSLFAEKMSSYLEVTDEPIGVERV